ncbi:F-box/FBD/LRR-repeat protein-like protein [Tanacetum coccineum]|uniref:F-box/FBD/LRR-repeat protein-like protein n=1 Tax=Tanacetum coccineum TaxID=301880 RepID=A0ABQ5ETC4_9ASTR
MDRISNLPPPIIESILCLVPIKEAARTSILSNEWRYRWTKIPKLVFKEDMFEVHTFRAELPIMEGSFDELNQRKWMTKRCKLFYAIYQVLLKHAGPVHEFSLSMGADVACVEIDHIIFHLLSKNTLKKLTLDIPWDYRLPLSVFSLHHLTDLHLNSCELHHQPPFKNNIDYIGVDDSTIANLFERLPVVESLSIYLWTVKLFIKDGVPRELPTTLAHLKYVYVDYMCFIYKYGLNFLALLMRCSPNLEKLKLQIFNDPMDESDKYCSYTIEDCSDIWLEHLNELEIKNFSNEKDEMDFVKLILAKSPVLKKVKLILWEDVDEEEELQITRLLLPSPRASKAVTIILEHVV